MTHAVTETLGQEQMLCSKASPVDLMFCKHNGNIPNTAEQQRRGDTTPHQHARMSSTAASS